MTDSCRMAHSRTGLFWFIRNTNGDGEVFGLWEYESPHAKSGVMILDSPFEHWFIWEREPYRAKLPLRVLDQDYFAFPRGRVLFDISRNRHRIYCDPVLLAPETKAQIKAFFQLEGCPVIWKTDPHYTTQDFQLDNLWNDDL